MSILQIPRRGTMGGSKLKRPDYIRPKGVAESASYIDGAVYGVLTDFVLKPNQTYSITARRRASPFYTNVFGASLVDYYPFWNGSQFYFSSSYFNTAVLRVGVKTTSTFTNTYNFNDTLMYVFRGGSHDRGENMDFYELKISENNNVVFDGIADFDANGNACIHDIIADKYYYATGGTDKFEGGWD